MKDSFASYKNFSAHSSSLSSVLYQHTLMITENWESVCPPLEPQGVGGGWKGGRAEWVPGSGRSPTTEQPQVSVELPDRMAAPTMEP